MLNDGNDSIATRIFWCGTSYYDPETVNVFLRLAENAQTILDIGANTGIYGLLAGTNFPNARIHAFEPVPAIYERLKASVQANALHNISVQQSAVSDKTGRVEFYVPVDSAAFTLSASMNRDFRQQSIIVNVECTTIDEYARKAKLDRIDLIKLDTESTEHLVLRGASGTLNNSQPLIVCEVLPDVDQSQKLAAIAPYDYLYFWIGKDALYQKNDLIGDSELQCYNYIFIPRSKCVDVLDRLRSIIRVVTID